MSETPCGDVPTIIEDARIGCGTCVTRCSRRRSARHAPSVALELDRAGVAGPRVHIDSFGV